MKFLNALSKRSDLLLAFLLICIVFMMILPLPTGVIDVLIGVNLSIAAILLMAAVYLTDVVQLSAFPSILLLTTLFRLALAISTTRLILIQADAGHIIETFGRFVVGGNLVVGLVVFLILTIVNFMVITKGSERVAEVSARFSLDSMPGKQMSIDSDMRAGMIELDEAQAAPQQAREGEPALRRHGRRDEVREGRRHRGPDHHRGQHDRRHRDRLHAARHVGRRGARPATRC